MLRIMLVTGTPPSIRQRCSVRPVRRNVLVSTRVILWAAAMILSVRSDTFNGISRITSSGTKRTSPGGGRLKPLRSCVVTGPDFGAGPREGGELNGCCGGNETCRNGGSGGSDVRSTSARSGGVRSPNTFVPRNSPKMPTATPPTTYQMTLLLLLLPPPD